MYITTMYITTIGVQNITQEEMLSEINEILDNRERKARVDQIVILSPALRASSPPGLARSGQFIKADDVALTGTPHGVGRANFETISRMFFRIEPERFAGLSCYTVGVLDDSVHKGAVVGLVGTLGNPLHGFQPITFNLFISCAPPLRALLCR